MIILDGSTQNLQAVLGGAVSTDEPEFQVTFGRLNNDALEAYETNEGELNGTTDVNLVAGQASKQLGIKSISLYNRDTASVTVTFKKDISATDRFLFQAILAANESAHYESGFGWHVTDSNGDRKQSGGISIVGTPVDNQITVWTGTNTIEGDSGLTWDGSTMTVTGTVETNDANGPALLNEVASSTNPTVNPDKTDADTGLGSAAADAMSLITGGVEASRISAATVQTTDTTITEITGIPVPSGEGFGFEIHVMGTQDSTGDSVFERIFGAIRNQGGTTALIGSIISDRTDDTGASTWTIAVDADDTADELTVDVTGEAAHTIDWKVRVHIMNV